MSVTAIQVVVIYVLGLLYGLSLFAWFYCYARAQKRFYVQALEKSEKEFETARMSQQSRNAPAQILEVPTQAQAASQQQEIGKALEQLGIAMHQRIPPAS